MLMPISAPGLMLSDLISNMDDRKVVSLDLETLVDSNHGFLTGERIIAISLSSGDSEIETDLFVAANDSQEEENRILTELDKYIESSKPEVIIGYNHTGYDIPLLQLKMRNRSYSEQLWSLKYHLGTAYTLDMMYVIAHDLYQSGEQYRIRKLRDAVNHKKYDGLGLMRVKELAVSPGMNVGETIKHLWMNDLESFRLYCEGDTRDILRIFNSIFRK